MYLMFLVTNDTIVDMQKEFRSMKLNVIDDSR